MKLDIPAIEDDSWYESFPEEVVAEAKRVIPETPFLNREPVSGITIDHAKTKVFENAFWIEEKSGLFILSVHITDVAAIVPIGSKMDQAALLRVITFYFRNRVMTIFPQELIDSSLSLKEGQDRLAITIKIRISSEDFSLGGVEIKQTKMRIIHNYSCEEVTEIRHHDDHPLHSFFLPYFRLAQGLYKRRCHIDVTTPSYSISAETIMQELLILANRVIAEWLNKKKIPAVYRNLPLQHYEDDDIEEKTNAAKRFLGMEAHVREKLADSLDSTEYGIRPGTHMNLEIPAYVRMTRPIERYADIVVQRIVEALLTGSSSPYTISDLIALVRYLNARTIKLADKMQNDDQKKVLRTARNKLQTRPASDLARLPERGFIKFSLLLKAAFQDEQVEYENLFEAIRLRMRYRKITIKEVALILAESPKNATWMRIKEEVLDYCRKHSKLAPSVLNVIVSRNNDWSNPYYYEIVTPSGGYAYKFVVLRSGQPISTFSTGTAMGKRRARAKAALLFLQAIVTDSFYTYTPS